MSSWKIWTRNEALDYIAARTVINEETGCHEWRGSLTRDGYGQIGCTSLFDTFRIKGAHRLIDYLTTGKRATDRYTQILHSCDNRCCVNPAHLRKGTAAKNTRDMIERGRGRNGSTLQGSASPSAVLTEEAVKHIRSLIAKGRKLLDIANEYEVSAATISKINTGRTWKHVPV